MSDALKRVYGIDLGTTYSAIAYVDEHGKPVIVPNQESERITPSVVLFDGENVIVGDTAKESAKVEPDRVVSRIKQHMGDPHFVFEHDGQSYSPEEISSFILRKVVGDAEIALGLGEDEPITDVVITCPAYFGVDEREATANAGRLAGSERPGGSERADGRGDRLRPGGSRGPDRAGLRPRRRHVRRDDDRDQGPADPGHLHRRRPPARRRALGRGDRRPPGRRVQDPDGCRRRPDGRPRGPQRPVPPGRAGQEDAHAPREGPLPHHPCRPAGPRRAGATALRGADPTPARPDDRADPRDAGRRRGQGALRVRQDHPRRRRHPDAAGPGATAGRVRQGAGAVRPGRGRRQGRRALRAQGGDSSSRSPSSSRGRRSGAGNVRPLRRSARPRCRRPSTRSSNRPASP